MSNVVIIEDDEFMATSLRRYLEGRGMHVDCYADAPQIDKLSEAAPDLIIIDCILSSISGPDYLKRVRSEERFSHTPAIITTGYDEIYDGIQELKNEQCSILKKPFTMDELEQTIKTLHAA